MTVLMQLMFTDTMEEMEPYTNYTCKYCGKPFLKKHNKEMYCSDECRKMARLDQAAKYQRKRRLMIKNGDLVSNEYNNRTFLGTQYLSQHRKDDDDEEYEAILKEMKRLKLK